MIHLNIEGATQILCLGAHSDDIEIGYGGTILRLAEQYPGCAFHWVVFSAIGSSGAGGAMRGFVFRRFPVASITAEDLPGRPHASEGALVKDVFEELKQAGLIVYLAYNLEKVLLGRYWGAETLGIYGRAYQLVNIPTDNLNSAAGSVALAALSRVQNEPERIRSYFLKGYSLVLAVTLPITIVSALFADDLILVLLDPKWHGTAAVFRLLAPIIMIFALINPLGWLLFSVGMVGRSLKIALVLTPLVISGYLLGLPYGPKGVAIGYSAVLTLGVVPHVAWCVHGTVILLRDIEAVLSRPLLSSLVAAVLPFALLFFYSRLLSPLPRVGIRRQSLCFRW